MPRLYGAPMGSVSGHAPNLSDPTGTVAIVGAGTMGAGIAQVALEAGWRVHLHDPFPGAIASSRARITDGLRRRAAKHELLGPEAALWVDGQLDRLFEEPDLAVAVRGVDLVIEAIVEELGAKRELFETLDSTTRSRTILATNTSALSVSAVAEAATAHPGRVLGLHFFNPAAVMQLVEVVSATKTDPAALARATAIVAAWGKVPVRSADSPGFIVNRVNRPFTIEALRMLESGQAGVADIDTALRTDGFPMGPFELMDLVGLDVNLAAATGVWEGLGRPERLRPSRIQARLVEEGRLGRKTGLGFYRYEEARASVPASLDGLVPTPAGDATPLTSRVIVGRIRTALASEAASALGEGVASAGDIDLAMRLGAGHPTGPLGWVPPRA